MTASKDNMRRRTAAFLASAMVSGATVWLLGSIGRVRIGNEYTSQAFLIPVLCGYLIWNERGRIFATPESDLREASHFLTGAVVAGLGTWYFYAVRNAYLFSAFLVLSGILLVIASFAAFYGALAVRRAVFPFSMLLMAIPLPDSIVQGIISTLQAQSASLSAVLFSMIGVPVFKEGFFLTVPGVTIEVARECSGINSSIAMVLTMLLVARETLDSNWRRTLLVIATIPLSILKNAIRITALTMLALRVDPSFLTGRLHHQGGVVFYLIAIALMYPLWKLLKRGDRQDLAKNDLISKRIVHSSTPELHIRA